MESKSSVDMKPAVVDINEPVDSCSEIGQVSSVIYIDPEKEAAARRKFDKYVVPVSVIFLVLSTLDRNNVSEALVMKAPCIIDNCPAGQCSSLWFRRRHWTQGGPIR